MRSKKKIILIAGPTCSGKSSLAHALSKQIKGLKILEMSDPFFSYIKKKKIDLDKYPIKRLADEIRKQDALFFAKSIDEKIKKKKGMVLLVSGIRTKKELQFFKKRYKILLIFIKAKPNLRYFRIMERQKKGDPKNLKEFIKGEIYEEKWGLWDLEKYANLIVENNVEKQKAEIMFKNIAKKVREIL